MLKIAICDDEQSMRDKIKNCIDDYSIERDMDVIYNEFSTGLDFLRDKSQYHVVIMDYHLSGESKINGLSIAKKFRETNKDALIIFLSSYPKVVFASFEVDTFRFLVKPLEPHKLFKALDDAVQSVKDDDMTLTVKINGDNVIINIKSILYLESAKNYTLIRTGIDEIKCREYLTDMEQRLPAEFLCRCHRSFIVNLKHVFSYDNKQVILANKQFIPVGKSKYEEFNSAFLAYTKKCSGL